MGAALPVEDSAVTGNRGPWSNLASALGHPAHAPAAACTRTLRRLRRGVTLDDGIVTRPARVDRMSRAAKGATWLRFTLSEGRNRQIRRMGEAVGHRVLRLHRPNYAALEIRDMAPGEWRELTPEESRSLIARTGLHR